MTHNKAKEVINKWDPFINKWIDEIILAAKQLNTAELQDERLVGKEYKANLISKANESIKLNKQKILKVLQYI